MLVLLYMACHSNKQRIVPYFGRGVYVFDLVNAYLVLIIALLCLPVVSEPLQILISIIQYSAGLFPLYVGFAEETVRRWYFLLVSLPPLVPLEGAPMGSFWTGGS